MKFFGFQRLVCLLNRLCILSQHKQPVNKYPDTTLLSNKRPDTENPYQAARARTITE